uniref:RNA-dependent RNA polymerase n=1 Tax=Siphoviridae sp. ctWT735 TaxID=2825538 RepID=A0A8S5TU38_9CAUD|nr:MAG TPA: RNA-dependent RNA polymerase [Siphoviridae sp. ctWT735]
MPFGECDYRYGYSVVNDEDLEDEVLSDDELKHYGTPRHSGRYPWGSGENPYQRTGYFRNGLAEMRGKGLSDKEIMQAMGLSSTEFRQMNSISKDAQRAENISNIKKLKEQGLSNVEIGKRMVPPIGESQVRALLKEQANERANLTKNTAEFMKSQMATKKYLDVGEASERELSDILGYKVTAERRDTALAMLRQEGFDVVEIRVQQATNKRNFTTMKILAPEGTTKQDIYNNLDSIKSIGDYDNVSEMTSLGLKPPVSIDSSRVQVRYRDQGGLEKDGTIELRRGVNDISLGGANYAQVRIAVDGSHYLKGMAVYSDNLPDGVDILFNTNKTEDVPMLGPKDNTVLKPMKKTPDGKIDMANPFGATIKKQVEYDGGDGEKHQGTINIVNEEGNWADYSKTLSAQVLSKQPISLIKRQLDQSYNEKKQEFDTIMSLTNPAVKKKLLDTFSEDCDSAAVNLKAAALPRQATQVILPLTTIKPTEVFAPQYRDGEEVVLIRFPHAGVFEIPRLVVNNRNREGKSSIGADAKDAIGISSKVAEQLSGADFDGDTVLVIPVNDKIRIRSEKPLKELKDFDPKIEYKGYPGMKKINPDYKQKQMGVVSNLITDMTLQGAPNSEIARAVKYSMCIIDAEKHNLDYKRCYQDCDIDALKKEYQGGGGVATLISRAKSEVRVPERKNFSIDRDTNPLTGERKFRETGRSFTDKNGVKSYAEEKSTRMFETNDARTLISDADTPTERAYANYANRLKALANQARKEYVATPSIQTNKTAQQTYASEVDSLKAKLNVALKNAPRERQAQIVANVVVKAKKLENPDITKGEEKRLRQQALSAARIRFGANRQSVRINITDREWDAIQSGAVSNSLLMRVLANTDMDDVKQRSMPRGDAELSDAKQRRIHNMIAAGRTIAEVADAVGVSVSTVNKYS